MQIEGRNPVLECLVAQNKIKKLYVNQQIERDEKVLKILELAEQQNVEIKFKSKRFLNKIAETQIHQGIIAVKADTKNRNFAEYINDLETQSKEPFLVYIREAQNEYNVGSIMRSAEVVGAHAVILPPKTILSAQMVRASMGASEHIETINESLFQAIRICKERNIKVVGIEVTGEQYYYEADLSGPIMLIIGGEDRSLSEEIKNKCDFFVKIPMKGKVNSLNMSIAASIVMFDKIRPR